MPKKLLDREAHVLDVGNMHQNCGIDVVAEFKGGHRYQGGYGFDKVKLTPKQWYAILKNSTYSEYDRQYGLAKVWVVTVKRSQAKSTNDMSARGFINFLKNEGVPVVEADIPKSPYITWTIYLTGAFKNKIRRASIKKNFKKNEYSYGGDDYY